MMTMMKFRSLLAALLASAFLLLTACGQKGPLYLPEDGSGSPQTDQTEQDEQKQNGEDDEDNAASTD